MSLTYKVMQADASSLCLLVATLAGLASGGKFCERGVSWWDREHGICVPCTKCDPSKLAVKLPCEINKDTVCQRLHDVKIYFDTPKDYKESDSDYEYYEDSNYDVSEVKDISWELQTSTLTIAICGCVVFFAVVLVLTIYHARQWKLIKRALRSDMQDLTSKLKLMESGDTAGVPATPADHHIYCNIHVAKEALLNSSPNRKGLGNVYTQEKHFP